MDMSKFDVILGMDSLTAHRVIIDFDCRKLLHTHRTMFVLCFREISKMLYLRPCTTEDLLRISPNYLHL